MIALIRPEEGRVAKNVGNEDLIPVCVLDIDQRQAIGERGRDRLLEQDVVSLLRNRASMRVVGDVRRADEDDVTDSGCLEKVVELGKGIRRRHSISDLEQVPPSLVRLHHARDDESGVLSADQLGEHPIPASTRPDDHYAHGRAPALVRMSARFLTGDDLLHHSLSSTAARNS
jgi:hypothetical protein